MQRVDIKSLAIKTAILLWAVFCIYLFMRYPGSMSKIHESTMDNWIGLIPKLSRINFLGFLIASTRALIGLLVFCAACLGAGGSALAFLASEPSLKPGISMRWLAGVASAFLIGQGLLSAVFLTLAELSQLSPAIVGLTLAAAIGLGLYQVRAYLLRHPIPQDLKIRIVLDSDEKIMLLLAVLVLILSLSYTASRISFDSSALYFSDAKITALTHSVRYFINDPFVASIFQAGINYAALIALFGDQAARMYSWASGIVVILVSLAMAEELGLTKRARIILLVMIVSSTAILDLLGDGKIDLVSTAPALAAVYWMIANSERSRQMYLVTGFLAGMAMAARPFNMLLMPTILLLLAVQNTVLGPSANDTQKYQKLLDSALWIGIGAIPWIAYILATNWIIAGDLMAFIRNYAKLRSEGYQLAFPADNVWLFRLLYPFAITFLNTGQSLGDISPLFLGLLPVVLRRPVRYRARTSRPFSFVIAAAAVTLLVWLLITSMVFEIRYVIFLWILLFMPVAIWASAALEDPDVLIRGLVRLAIISMLVFNALRTIYISLDTYSPVSKQGNAQCYDFEPCAILAPVNQMALPGDRVLMLDAFRYYLRSDLFACSTTNAEYSLLQKLSRTDNLAFWTEAYREGNSFVVYQQVYGVRHLNLGIIPNPYNTPPWLTLVPIAGRPGDTEVVYRLIATNPPVAIEKNCVDTGDFWEVQLDDATTFIHSEAPVLSVTDWVVELRQRLHEGLFER